MNIEEKKLNLFENWRKESIGLLDESKIDKDEFLNLNYNFIKKLDLKPFSQISTAKEAIYNYQYYNIMAKRCNFEARLCQNFKKKKKNYNKLINDRENYYYLKDIATQRLLEIIDYKNMESYYIILKSKRLKGSIFEINVLDMEKTVLHSKNKKLLEKLREKGVFNEDSKESIIDSYVNKSY